MEQTGNHRLNRAAKNTQGRNGLGNGQHFIVAHTMLNIGSAQPMNHNGITVRHDRRSANQMQTVTCINAIAVDMNGSDR